MMDIVMLVAGAGVGMLLMDIFVTYRRDMNKGRQQLESKTPYDYALTNAQSDNKRYRDELVTIQALKRTEADTERIRIEIDTILSEGGEEPTESVYDVERLLINDIKDKASENLELAVEFAKITVQDDEAIRKQLEETSKELAEEIREARRRIREFREEGKYYGETLH